MKLEIEVPEDADDAIEIELPAGRITGTVIDRESQPVARATVTAGQVRGPVGGEEYSADYLSSTDVTDDLGRFSLEGLPPGAWDVGFVEG
jgi:hypothetical protein